MPSLSPAQNEQYFRIRLDAYKLHPAKGMEFRSICPLHGGSNPTQFWVDLAEGNWCCFTCGSRGPSAYMLEQKLLANELNRSPLHDEVQRALEAILQTPLLQRVYPEPVRGNAGKAWNRKQAQDWYRYVDELGHEVFTVWRFVDRKGHKMTPADRPCPCNANPDAECVHPCPDGSPDGSPDGCVDGRLWSTKGVRRVLYRLPDVIASSVVFVVEGEKNANDLARALAEFIRRKGGFPLGNMALDRVAVTTNPGGAQGWKPAYGYGRYFAGKIVIKLGDNDAPGRMHDRDVCTDVSRHALKTFTLALPFGERKDSEGPDMAEVDTGQDISDYLASHTVDEFLALLPQRKEWAAPAPETALVEATLDPRPLLVPPSALAPADGDPRGDYLVTGLIERNTRGLVVAPPKTGKSLLFLELALCLATRRSFLGAPAYPRAIKCAVISREDGPVMVLRRLRQLAAARGIPESELDANILVNTEAQSASFKIDRQADLEEMADWLKMSGVEFCVVDVLNRLHDQQENNSDDMTRVMLRFDELAQRAGCQVTVIHHTNKAGGVKGSTSIEGWADWIVRLEQSQDDEAIKTLFLRTKSSGSVVPRTIRYWQSEDETQSRIQVVETRRVAA